MIIIMFCAGYISVTDTFKRCTYRINNTNQTRKKSHDNYQVYKQNITYIFRCKYSYAIKEYYGIEIFTTNVCIEQYML